MNKAELVDAAALATDQKKSTVDNVLTAILEEIVYAVAEGQEVTLVGFGTFRKRHREARPGRNPGTGEPIQIPAADVPAFYAGKKFKDAVKG